MKQIVSLHLLPTTADQQRLLELQHTFNAACAYIVTEARGQTSNGVFALQGRTIGTLLDHFQLPMPLALRAVIVVAQALAHSTGFSLAFPPEQAIVLDEQLVGFQGLTHLSIVTLKGSISIPFFIKSVRRAREHARQGEVMLRSNGSECWLTLILDSEQAKRTVASAPEPVV